MSPINELHVYPELLDHKGEPVCADSEYIACSVLASPRFRWSLEVATYVDNLAIPTLQQGLIGGRSGIEIQMAQVPKQALTGRMVIERIRDDDVAAKVGIEFDKAPPGTVIDRWVRPIAECHESVLGIVIEPQSKIAKAGPGALAALGKG
jgi:hypothetical protein